ncbi:MAG: transposase, partial [Dermatophilaceae bacterium]
MGDAAPLPDRDGAARVERVLNGRVEVDETFIGGEEPGPRGRGALGKTLVVIAVELREPRGYGRARMSIIPNAEAQT